MLLVYLVVQNQKNYYYICIMKYLGVSLIYLGFFGLVGSAVYFTGSGQCLWALLLTPSLNFKENGKSK